MPSCTPESCAPSRAPRGGSDWPRSPWYLRVTRGCPRFCPWGAGYQAGPDTREGSMASDAVTLIKEDHRLMESLFQRLQAGKGDRRALVDEVAARFTAHARAEEQHVYPAIAEADPDEREDVRHARHEHDEAEELLTRVQELVDSPEFEQVFTEFVEAVDHHVQEEEEEVLPALQEAVDADTLVRLGEIFEKAR